MVMSWDSVVYAQSAWKIWFYSTQKSFQESAATPQIRFEQYRMDHWKRSRMERLHPMPWPTKRSTQSPASSSSTPRVWVTCSRFPYPLGISGSCTSGTPMISRRCMLKHISSVYGEKLFCAWIKKISWDYCNSNLGPAMKKAFLYCSFIHLSLSARRGSHSPRKWICTISLSDGFKRDLVLMDGDSNIWLITQQIPTHSPFFLTCLSKKQNVVLPALPVCCFVMKYSGTIVPPIVCRRGDHAKSSTLPCTGKRITSVHLHRIWSPTMLTTAEILLEYVCPALGCIVAYVMFMGAWFVVMRPTRHHFLCRLFPTSIPHFI